MFPGFCVFNQTFSFRLIVFVFRSVQNCSILTLKCSTLTIPQCAILVRPTDLRNRVERRKKRYSLFAQLGAFLGKCALPSTKREGSTGYGGCARIHGRQRRRTALDGNLNLRRYQIHANIPFIWSVDASPPRLNIRVLKGKTLVSNSGCSADQRRPQRLQRRVCRLRWTKRTWREMAAAAQTAAAAEAAAASLDLYMVDGRCRRFEARDTRRRAAARRRLRRHFTRRVLTASACLGPKARKHDSPFCRLTIGQNDEKGLEGKWVIFWFFRGSCAVLVFLFW